MGPDGYKSLRGGDCDQLSRLNPRQPAGFKPGAPNIGKGESISPLFDIWGAEPLPSPLFFPHRFVRWGEEQKGEAETVWYRFTVSSPRRFHEVKRIGEDRGNRTFLGGFSSPLSKSLIRSETMRCTHLAAGSRLPFKYLSKSY